MSLLLRTGVTESPFIESDDPSETGVVSSLDSDPISCASVLTLASKEARFTAFVSSPSSPPLCWSFISTETVVLVFVSRSTFLPFGKVMFLRLLTSVVIETLPLSVDLRGTCLGLLLAEFTLFFGERGLRKLFGSR